MIRRYTLAEMGAIWSDAAHFEEMLRVELAVARVQAARRRVRESFTAERNAATVRSVYERLL